MFYFLFSFGLEEIEHRQNHHEEMREKNERYFIAALDPISGTNLIFHSSELLVI